MEPCIISKEPLGDGFFVNVSRHHTFGTDAILLANFAAPKKMDNIIDLGTGCGIIPLLFFRNGLKGTAWGVDISPEACALARKTIAELNLESFNIHEGNLTELRGKVPFGMSNVITCNPPYKAPNAGIKNNDTVITTARHETECTLEDIVSVSAKLLQTSGRLCMCHRPERLAELMSLMSKYGLEPKRLRLVCQRKGEEPWLVLLEGRKGGKIGLRIAPTLYVEENGALSEEMIKIYGAYKEAYL